MSNFNLSGKIPVFNIALQIYVMGEIIHGKLDLIILFEISSYPLEFLSFNDLIIFSASYVEAYCNFILVKGLLKEFTK
jgi:hypothetical protein